MLLADRDSAAAACNPLSSSLSGGRARLGRNCTLAHHLHHTITILTIALLFNPIAWVSCHVSIFLCKKKTIIHCQVKIHFKNLSGLHHIIRLIALILLRATNFASFAARINNRLPGGVYVAQLGHCNSVPRIRINKDKLNASIICTD
jgi:hypothetical protein